MDAEFVFDMEKPGDLIVRIADSRKANYLVMGTRGQGKIRRIVCRKIPKVIKTARADYLSQINASNLHFVAFEFFDFSSHGAFKASIACEGRNEGVK